MKNEIIIKQEEKVEITQVPDMTCAEETKAKKKELVSYVKNTVSILVKGMYFTVSLAFAAMLGYVTSKMPVIDTEQKMVAFIIVAMSIGIFIFIAFMLLVVTGKNEIKNKKSK